MLINTRCWDHSDRKSFKL